MTGDRGGASVLVVGWVAVVVTIGVATASLGALIAAREQANTAAQAAALAAAVSTYPPAGTGAAPRALAVEFAERNASRLVSCRCPVDPTLRARVVVVTTALDVEVPIFGEVTVSAAARSEFDPALWLGG